MRIFFFRMLPLFIALMSAYGRLSAQDYVSKYRVANIPDSLIEEGTNAVIREYSTVITVESEKKYVEWERYAVTLLNDQAKALTAYRVYYDMFTKVTDIEASMYDAGGNLLKTLKSKDINDYAYDDGFSIASDNRYKFTKFTPISYPVTVVFMSEASHTNTMFYPRWSPQLYRDDIAVEKAAITVRTAAGMGLRYKIQELPEPRKSNSANMSVWYWEVKNLRKMYVENFAAEQNSAICAPHLLLAPNRFQVDGYFGNMKTWQEFGAFKNQLYKGRDVLPQSAIADANNLVKDCTTPECKIEKIYSYVQKNMRYISIQLGIGGWQPMLAQEVHTKKYGDCKALTNYTKAMLNAVGVKSYVVCVSAGNDFLPLDKNFVSSNFNHVILSVPMEKDTVWLECTSQDNPIGYMGTFTGNREALLMTETGGIITRTPTYTEEQNQIVRKASFAVSSEGAAACIMNTRYVGLTSDNYVSVCDFSVADKENFFHDNVGLSNYKLEKLEYIYRRKRLPEVEENVKLNFSAYAKKSGKRLFLPINVYKSRFVANPDTTKARLFPVQFTNTSFKTIDSIEFVLPDTYSIEAEAKSTRIESVFGTYDMKVSIIGNKVVLVRQCFYNNSVQSKEKYRELLDFLNKIAKADASKIVLVSNR